MDMPANRTKGLILVVEDQEGWLIIQLLEAYDEPYNELEIYLAANGEEAILKFETYRPDVTILDLRLPRLSGFGVLEGIRKIEPTAYIIILTAYGDAKTRKMAKEAKANEFFTKPLDIRAMHHRLREIIRSLRKVNPIASEGLKPNYVLEHCHRILTQLHRRQNLLEERKARLGYESPPALLMEIQDINSEIEYWTSLLDDSG